MAADDRFNWAKNTRSFTTEGSQPARLLLRQVGDDDFQLGGPFLFTHPVTGREIPVSADLLTETDLASVPAFLGWFVRRHGRHTFAALMHDELITDKPESLPEPLRMSRAEADLQFRDALVDSQVPLVKAWIMWAGVAAGTRWSMRPWGAAGLAAWVLSAVAGTVVLVVGVLTGNPVLTAAAVVAPVPFALLWGRQWAAGLTAGYALWFVAAGALPAWLAYQVYRAVEWAVIPIRALRQRNKGVPMPTPPPYSKR